MNERIELCRHTYPAEGLCRMPPEWSGHQDPSPSHFHPDVAHPYEPGVLVPLPPDYDSALRVLVTEDINDARGFSMSAVRRAVNAALGGDGMSDQLYREAREGEQGLGMVVVKVAPYAQKKAPDKQRIAEILKYTNPNRDRRDFGRLPNEMQRDISLILEAYASNLLFWGVTE